MRQFKVYTLQRETPAPESGRRISIPEFMITQEDHDDKPGSKGRALVIVQIIATFAVCWFFMALDIYGTAAWIGLVISLITLISASVRSDSYDLD